MKTDKLKEICFSCQDLVREVGVFIKTQVGAVQTSSIETKSRNSLVSYVDKTAEEKLVAGLSKILPEAVFLTEEETVPQKKGTYQWIIDPLDGTTNFLHQIPVFSISVALRQEEEIVIGIVYEINSLECFYAWKGGGAWLNKRPIKATYNGELSEALVATGFPYYDFSKMESYFEVLQYFVSHTRGVRRLGSAAVDLAYVACGRFDTYFEYSLHAWDVAAGILLVKESGGKVCDFYGGTDYLFGGSIIASGSNIHTKVAEHIQSKFKEVH